MDDDKKPPPPDVIATIIAAFLILSVVAAILGNTYRYIANNGITFYGISIVGVWRSVMSHTWVYKIISFVVSGAACVGIVIFSQKSGEVYKVEKAKLFPTGEPQVDSGVGMPEVDNEMKERWDKIVLNSESPNEPNWRMAIIDADIILDDLLDKLNLPGDTIGEKLKAVEKSDFLTIENAWEAHKMRNEIAHPHPSFQLSQRETRRTISLYQSVFKEFYLI